MCRQDLSLLGCPHRDAKTSNLGPAAACVAVVVCWAALVANRGLSPHEDRCRHISECVSVALDVRLSRSTLGATFGCDRSVRGRL